VEDDVLAEPRRPGRALGSATTEVPVVVALVLLVLMHHLLLLVLLLLLRLLLVVLLLRLRMDHGSRPPRRPPPHPAASHPHWSGLWRVVRTPSTTRVLVEVAQAPLTAS
jgi:hypothetical protein